MHTQITACSCVWSLTSLLQNMKPCPCTMAAQSDLWGLKVFYTHRWTRSLFNTTGHSHTIVWYDNTGNVCGVFLIKQEYIEEIRFYKFNHHINICVQSRRLWFPKRIPLCLSPAQMSFGPEKKVLCLDGLYMCFYLHGWGLTCICGYSNENHVHWQWFEWKSVTSTAESCLF